uniref:fibrinogen-like protein A n=1 Tax=Styela clava TaxID=7725 RepID=UPI00193A2EF1|nr:fibrinogen-like protein A [Styela clava]
MFSYYLLMCILCITSTLAQTNVLSPPYTCTTTTTLCQPGETTEHAPSTLQTSISQGRPGKRGMNGLPGIKGEKGEPCQCDIVDEEAMRDMRRKMDEIGIENREMKQQIRDLETKNDQINKTVKKIGDSDFILPSSCDQNGMASKIYPRKSEGDLTPIEVNCGLYSVNEDGWITIQRRQNGAVRFYDRDWKSYATGFGDKNKEFWLGLRTIHQLTTSRNYKLRIDMRTKSGTSYYAEYSTFKVGSEKSKFQLTISGYSGDDIDRMSYHNQQYFTTYDVDNDSNGGNCARQFNGAWWYKSCYHSNLNGKYDSHFSWVGNLSFSEMKIHPV